MANRQQSHPNTYVRSAIMLSVFTFRSKEQWRDIFSQNGFRVGHTESYRPKWPTLAMYHHSLFVLDRRI